MAPPAHNHTSVETLVHISAPSGARDDANYRTHADACLDFQPVTSLRLSEVHAGTGDGDGNLNPAPVEIGQSSANPFAGGDISVGDQFDDSVFDDADDTQRTTSLDSRGDNASAEAFQRPRPPWFAYPPSSAPKSSARIEISLLSSSENSQSQNAGQAAPPPQPTPTPAHLDPDPPLPVPNQDSLLFQTPPSTVPDSQPGLTPGWDVERNRSPGDGRIALLQVQGSQAFSSQELQTPAKRRRLSVDLPPRSSGISTFPPSSASIQAPDTAEDASVHDAVGVEDITTLLSRLPMEIHPARPAPSSTAEFTTHITPTLHMLAERMNLTRVFKPAHQTRPLRTLERGYWLLRLPISTTPQDPSTKTTKEKDSAWPLPVFDQFWKYLSTFIATENRAGWGVWCICEGDAESPNPNTSTNPNPHTPATITITVKIYTWGEIAAHIYLLLYLASERRIKRVRDVQWRDGGEGAVIWMGMS